MMFDQRSGAMRAAGGDGKALAQRDVEHLRDRPEKFVARRKIDRLVKGDISDHEASRDQQEQHGDEPGS